MLMPVMLAKEHRGGGQAQVAGNRSSRSCRIGRWVMYDVPRFR
jgi:hypothetical protein